MNENKAAALLVINAGSSSVKYRVYALKDLSLLGGDKIMRIGEDGGAVATHEDAFLHILNETSGFYIVATAHRIVHGGESYTRAVRVTPDIVSNLRALCTLAPLHQPHNLNAIEIFQKIRPDIIQYADFDTGFHAGHDVLYDTYALPEKFRHEGLRKYGFHGLSYESVCMLLKEFHPELYTGSVVIAHLGNGSSLCAVRNGRSIDTTMGMSTLDGLPMGTRCGSIDPGILLYLARTRGMGFEEIEDMLYHRSGLLGLSGVSNDVKTLMESSDSRATFALDYYSFKVAQHIAAMVVSLGQVDAVVFTGGIGENSEEMRSAILSHLEFLPPFRTLILQTDEEMSVARHVKRLMDDGD